MNTVLLALLAASAEGIGIFKTFGGVKRTGSDDSGIQLDLTFYWPIRTSAEAKELDPVIAGASAMYADRDSRDDDDPAKSDYAVTRKFQDDARHLTLNLIQDGGEGGGRVILSDQGCSVLQTKVTTSKKAASYEVKVRVFGLTPAQVGTLAEGLTSRVGISLVTDQQALFGEGKDGKGKVIALRSSITPKIGQLVSGKLSSGTEFAGIVKDISTDGLVTVDDFDGEIEVSTAQITSALSIVPPKGKMMDWVRESYEQKAEKKGTPKTWAAILAALGEVHAQNLTPTETWTVSSSIIDAAAKIKVTPTAPAPEATEEDEEEPGNREAVF